MDILENILLTAAGDLDKNYNDIHLSNEYCAPHSVIGDGADDNSIFDDTETKNLELELSCQRDGSLSSESGYSSSVTLSPIKKRNSSSIEFRKGDSEDNEYNRIPNEHGDQKQRGVNENWNYPPPKLLKLNFPPKRLQLALTKESINNSKNVLDLENFSKINEDVQVEVLNEILPSLEITSTANQPNLDLYEVVAKENSSSSNTISNTNNLLNGPQTVTTCTSEYFKTQGNDALMMNVLQNENPLLFESSLNLSSTDLMHNDDPFSLSARPSFSKILDFVTSPTDHGSFGNLYNSISPCPFLRYDSISNMNNVLNLSHQHNNTQLIQQNPLTTTDIQNCNSGSKLATAFDPLFFSNPVPIVSDSMDNINNIYNLNINVSQEDASCVINKTVGAVMGIDNSTNNLINEALAHLEDTQYHQRHECNDRVDIKSPYMCDCNAAGPASNNSNCVDISQISRATKEAGLKCNDKMKGVTQVNHNSPYINDPPSNAIRGADTSSLLPSCNCKSLLLKKDSSKLYDDCNNNSLNLSGQVNNNPPYPYPNSHQPQNFGAIEEVANRQILEFLNKNPNQINYHDKQGPVSGSKNIFVLNSSDNPRQESSVKLTGNIDDGCYYVTAGGTVPPHNLLPATPYPSLNSQIYPYDNNNNNNPRAARQHDQNHVQQHSMELVHHHLHNNPQKYPSHFNKPTQANVSYPNSPYLPQPESRNQSNLNSNQIKYHQKSICKNNVYNIRNNNGIYGSFTARSRDLRRAESLKIPFNIDEIIYSPIDEFTDMLRKQTLTESQISLIRDIRRRGKNKVAAQNCRKRKIDGIADLERNVDYMKNSRIELCKEKIDLKNELRIYQQRFNELYMQILTSLRDERGLPYSNKDYMLQFSSGNLFLLPKEDSSLNSNRKNGVKSHHHNWEYMLTMASPEKSEITALKSPVKVER